MANTPQAKKRVRQAEKKRQHNASWRSTERTMIKKTVKAINEGRLEDAKVAYSNMQTVLDRNATRGLGSANKAARHKSRLFHRLAKIQ